MDLLETNVKFVRGVGEKRAALFKKLGVTTVRDLLYFFPRRYEDWVNVTPISGLTPGQTACVRAALAYHPSQNRTHGGTVLTRLTLTDGTGLLPVIFFNNRYVLPQLSEETEYLFYGKVEENGEGRLSMASPKFLPAEGNAYFHPVYRQTEGLSSRAVSTVVKTALTLFETALAETLDEEKRKAYRLPDLPEALRRIHFPQDFSEVEQARRRLIYDELLVLQLGLLTRGRREDETAVPVPDTALPEFLSRLPFSPTGAQTRSIRECLDDMAGMRPMRRLLQGDVGSGKTAVAAALIFCAARAGLQSALMAPTEVLARQHYATFLKFYEGAGVKVALLTGSTGAKARREILAALKAGDVDLLIGTHAVITPDVEFSSLALAVTDEQHRFGVNQRGALSGKGQSPHVLVMSATPIPRTLSLIVYGDLDVSVLDEKPAGRQEIDTFAVDSSFRERICRFLKKQLDEGRQAYIVCPLAQEKDDEDEEEKQTRLNAEKYMKELSSDVFAGYRTALLHGKMRPKEKEAVMADFTEGRTQLLICTVVIEVGVDVPNATVIVIENAECFGLAQLHQLRGRVGRSDEKSYCILISDAKSEAAKERFAVMTGTNDGFEIAKKDLELRGPGDFFGQRQSGLPEMKIADLMTDSRVMYVAQSDAKKILEDDPGLEKEEHKELAAAVSRLFAEIS